MYILEIHEHYGKPPHLVGPSHAQGGRRSTRVMLQTGASSERGRLVLTALGDGQFGFDVVKRAARGER